ncbi:MAG: CT583 family protein [Verrucomicrobia bacterium]|nr:CT583 family protein [Verrucomicrobiota bacterium]
MSKPSVITNTAFQQKPPMAAGFNLVNQTNSFNSVFDVKPLDHQEDVQLQKILHENFLTVGAGKEKENAKLSQDWDEMKAITSQIKAIGKQGTVLIGERVFKAREILKSYKDGTFTKWLELAFGTRKTGYNMLAYYELYNALPHADLKDNFKKIPQKTAYILASRDGDLNKKAEIIREYHDLSHEELVILIQDKFPVASSDKRASKDSNSRFIAAIRDTLEKLQKRKSDLTQADKVELKSLKALIDSIIS